MLIKMSRRAAVVALIGIISSMPAWSQTTPAVLGTPEAKLAAQYADFAGSQSNAESLVTGLRDGKNVLMISTKDPNAVSMTFTPATPKLGVGNC